MLAIRLVPAALLGLVAAALPAQKPHQGLLWSTFLGGEGDEYLQDVARDAFGRLYVCGRTTSQQILTTPDAYDTTANGGWDAYVACLDPSASGAAQLVWATFVGGAGDDAALSIAVDPTGRFVTLGGFTNSASFPRTHGRAYSALRDAFVLRFDLSQSGTSQLVWSHLLGDSGMEWVADLVVDAAGVVTAAGMTTSARFPVTPGAFDTTLGGVSDAFVLRLQSDGQLQWSTFLGGSGEESHWPRFALDWFYDRRLRVAVDEQRRPIVAGSTFSVDFPVTANAVQSANAGNTDLFASRLDAAGANLEFSTYYGDAQHEWLNSMALDREGGVSLTAVTNSPTFRTTANAYSSTFSGAIDALVLRFTHLDAPAARLDYASYIGGNGDDVLQCVARESSGAFVLVGNTDSSNFPTTPGAPRRTRSGAFDIALMRLQPEATASRLLVSTLVGGSSGGAGWDCLLDGAGGIVGIGTTRSSDFPTTPGALQTTIQGAIEATVWAHDLLPDDVFRYGASTPACRGPLAIQVESQPAPGNAAFAVRCDDAPPLAVGVLLLGQPFSSGWWIWNAQAFVLPDVLLAASSDAHGFASLTIPVPAALPPTATVGFQWLWVNTPQCSVFGLSASNALRWN